MEKARNENVMPGRAGRQKQAIDARTMIKTALPAGQASATGPARGAVRKLAPGQRAARYLRRNALYIIGLVLILAGMLALMPVMRAVDRKLGENSIRDYGRERQYIEYTVKPGDTLWTISEDMSSVMPEYAGTKAYLNDIKAVNRTGDRIRSGQKLMLPYYDKGSGQSAIFAAYGIPGVN